MVDVWVAKMTWAEISMGGGDPNIWLNLFVWAKTVGPTLFGATSLGVLGCSSLNLGLSYERLLLLSFVSLLNFQEISALISLKNLGLIFLYFLAKF